MKRMIEILKANSIEYKAEGLELFVKDEFKTSEGKIGFEWIDASDWTNQEAIDFSNTKTV